MIRAIEQPNHANLCPERRLFVGVILNAIQEASGQVKAVSHAKAAVRAKADALAWIEQAGEDFQIVCHLAGLEPTYVQRRALAHIRRDTFKPGMHHQGATMSDVAKRAGVSATTVARVLDRHPAVTLETRRKVKEAVAACGFIRNLVKPSNRRAA